MELYLHSRLCLHIVHRHIVLYLVTILIFSAVGIPTGYGLGGLGFASPWRYQWRGRGEVPYSCTPSSRPTHSGYPVSFLRVKRPGRGVNHEPFSIAPLRSWYIYRAKLTFTLVPSLRGICGKRK